MHITKISTDELVQRIHSFQSTKDDGKFQAGLFFAFRYYPYLNLHRADNNLFFTALTVHQLREALPHLNQDIREVISGIIQKATSCYNDYQVIRQGVKVYQFWPVGSKKHFPNGKVLRYFKKFKSPPDADDTALAYLSLPHSRDAVVGLKNYLIQFANGSRKSNLKAIQPLRIKGVYSTWMGTGVMPIEFDVVVMCNLLRVIMNNNIPLNEYDLATLSYLKKIISIDYFIDYPFYSAPWYPFPIIIFYHLVFLFSDFFPELFLEFLPKFKKQYYKIKGIHNGIMDKAFLDLIALRINERPIGLDFEAGWTIALQKFPYYIGGMLTATQNRFYWKLAKYSCFHWQFVSPAFNYSVLLNWRLQMEKNK